MKEEHSNESQCKKIIKYLREGNTLTPMEALRNFDCFRLGARIYELKDRGNIIETEIIKLSNGKRVARYSLPKSH
jgi:hypothetical protein